MVEKKKKRGQFRWLRVVLLLAIYCAGFGGAALIYLAGLAKNEPAPVYLMPPPRIPILINGKVIDAQGQPVNYQSLLLSHQVDSGEGGGSTSTAGEPLMHTFILGSYPESNGVSGGCVWGSIEIEGYPRYGFEYGLGNIEWGAVIDITITAAEDGIKSEAVSAASHIKPAMAAEPVVYSICPPQLQYPLSVTPIPAG
jgi:hypothetical protein